MQQVRPPPPPPPRKPITSAERPEHTFPGAIPGGKRPPRPQRRNLDSSHPRESGVGTATVRLSEPSARSAEPQPHDSPSRPSSRSIMSDASGDDERDAEGKAPQRKHHLRSSTLSLDIEHIQNGSDKKNLIVDVLQLMGTFTTFLKYGKWGGPKFRDVRFDLEALVIEYTSQKKNSSKARIPLQSVERIQHGRASKNFRRFKPSAQLDQASFSIMYERAKGKKKKTLDLVAQNKADFLLWTNGLQKLMHILKAKGELGFRQNPKVSMKMPSSAAYTSFARSAQVCPESSAKGEKLADQHPTMRLSGRWLDYFSVRRGKSDICELYYSVTHIYYSRWLPTCT